MIRTTLLLPIVALSLVACDRQAEPVAADLQIGASPDSPVQLTYVKIETGPGTAQWTGSVSGDAVGNLRTTVRSLEITGAVWHITTFWEVDAGTRSFQAALDGTVNTTTGRLVLSGRVVSGALSGAQVYCDGQLTGIDPVTGGTVFEGSVTIMTGSRDR